MSDGENPMKTLNWYFDFISPYAYLQSTRLDDFAQHAVVRCHPVLFAGLRNGINVIQNESPALLSTYRFHTSNAIPFDAGLTWRVNWQYEFKDNEAFHQELLARRDAGGAWLRRRWPNSRSTMGWNSCGRSHRRIRTSWPG